MFLNVLRNMLSSVIDAYDEDVKLGLTPDIDMSTYQVVTELRDLIDSRLK